MRIFDAQFLTSATGPEEGTGWPNDPIDEIAFVGRSNVGKSTLLQALTGRRGLVRISGTPGRTRLINFFALEVAPNKAGAKRPLRLVDLPGYGYARVSKAEREEWFPFVERYFKERKQLRAAVILVDARRGAELDETELVKFLTARQFRVVVAVTKSDKLAKHERKPAGMRVHKALAEAGAPAPVVLVSGETLDGVDDLWQKLSLDVG